MEVKEKVYESRLEINPRIIYEALGSKIIESDSIAISEQIKNAVDAKANDIIVDFSMYYEDLIIISDNGEGMSRKEIEEYWFFVGATNKTNIFQQLGGKGIGRFSLFRLANSIKLESVKNGIKSTFIINKNDLEKEETTNQVSINIIETEAESGEKGTWITLSEVNKNINFNEIKKELENLTPPFEKKLFSIKFPEKQDLIEFINPSAAVKDAHFYAEVEFEGNNVHKYNFTCRLQGESIYSNKSNLKINKNIAKNNFNVNIGKTRLYLYNFYFDKKYSENNIDENHLKKGFLLAYQGISIYRNKFKIYGHGEEDWLKLAEKRLQKPGDNIDNKLTFGYILLDTTSSYNLEEKTNREGFLRNESSKNFKSIVEIIVKQIGEDRKKSIKKIKEEYVKKQKENNSNPDKPVVIKNPSSKVVNGGVNTGNNVTSGSGYSSDKNGTNHSIANNKVENDVGSNTDENKKENRYSSRKKIGDIDEELRKRIKSDKITDLITEIVTIDATKYTYATSFLYRSLIEVTMDEYIRNNIHDIPNGFNNYNVDEDNLVGIKYYDSKNKKYIKKQIPIRKKILDFKRYFTNRKMFDARSLKSLDELASFVDDLNLAIHWGDKKVSVDNLQANWSNTKFFLEHLLSEN